ncbi:MAG: B12-binding domain-containing radical SAM protein [Nanobdellota archaeon]
MVNMETKIALINPPYLPNDLARITPNMGIVYVATVLNKKYETDIIDLVGMENPEQIMRKYAQDYTHFGFFSTSLQFHYASKLNRILKEENPKVTTFVGGPHASAILAHWKSKNDPAMNANYNALNQFDIVYGGEAASNYFIDDLLQEDERWRQLPLISDVSDMPIADRSLIDISSYKYPLSDRTATQIVSQLGCPYSCTYCAGRNIPMYNHVRSFSPNRVLKEMDYISDTFGFNAFAWFDDEVNVNPRRLFALSKALSKRDYIHRGFVRSDLIVKYPDTVEALKDAGFIELCTGVESGSDEVLQRIKKGTTSAVNLEASQIIKKSGMLYKSFMMLGHPREKPEDIEKSLDWLDLAEPDSVEVSITTPLPRSTLFNESVPSSKYSGYDREYDGLFFNLLDYSQEHDFHKSPHSYSEVRTDALTATTLMEIQNLIKNKYGGHC